jgi:hypothetical protein
MFPRCCAAARRRVRTDGRFSRKAAMLERLLLNAHIVLITGEIYTS